MKMQPNRIQKITVHIPQQVLQEAMEATNKNITETVKEALKELSCKKSCENFRALRGKVKFSIDLKKLREDR